MRCEEARQRLLSETGALPREIVAHLRGCQRCRDWRSEQEALSELFARVGHAAPPPHVRRSLWPAVQAEIARRQRQRQARSAAAPRLSAVAVVAFAVMVVGLILLGRWLEQVSQPADPWLPVASEQMDIVVQSAQIDGRDADVSIFEVPQRETVVIWLD